MSRPLPLPASYAPDATGVPALWPWSIPLPPRDHCAVVGCLGRPPKPRDGDAPAAIALCAACRAATLLDSVRHAARRCEP